MRSTPKLTPKPKPASTSKPISKPSIPRPLPPKPERAKPVPAVSQRYSAPEQQEAARNVDVAFDNIVAQGLAQPAHALRYKLMTLSQYIAAQPAFTAPAKRALTQRVKQYINTQEQADLTPLERDALDNYLYLFYALIHNKPIEPLSIDRVRSELEEITPENLSIGRARTFHYGVEFSRALYDIQTPENDHMLPRTPYGQGVPIEYTDTLGDTVAGEHYATYRNKEKFFLSGEIIAALRTELIPETQTRLDDLLTREKTTRLTHQEKQLKTEYNLLLAKQPRYVEWKGQAAEHYLANLPARLTEEHEAAQDILLSVMMPHQSVGDTVKKVDLINVQLTGPATESQARSITAVLDRAITMHTRKYTSQPELRGYRKSFDRDAVSLTPEAEQVIRELATLDATLTPLLARIATRIDTLRAELVARYPGIASDPSSLVAEDVSVPADLSALLRQERLLQSRVANLVHNYIHTSGVAVEFRGVQVKSSAESMRRHQDVYDTGTIHRPEALTRYDFLEGTGDTIGQAVGTKMNLLKQAYLEVFDLDKSD